MSDGSPLRRLGLGLSGLVALVGLLAIGACSSEGTRREQDCGNLIDDDGDQQVDCADPDCVEAPECRGGADADADADDDGDADLDADALSDGDAPADADGDAPADADGDAPADADGASCDEDADVGPRGGECDPGLGRSTYVRLYDARDYCGIHGTPNWSALYWEAETPGESRIVVTARSSNRFEELCLAEEVSVATIPSDPSPADLSGALLSAGVSNGRRYLELTARLSCEGAPAPAALTSLDLVVYCE